MIDAIVVGAGPAGSIAAFVLARAGARVLIVDRAEFPRDKLCGDTLNPGAIRLMAGLGLADAVLHDGRSLRGMRVSGPSVRVTCLYDPPAAGVALTRRVLDVRLLEAAVRAGARFEPGVVVRRPLIDDVHGLVRGVVLVRRGTDRELRVPALMVIAADGRSSTLARQLGLQRRAPIRRWAFGVYASDVQGMSDLGEMHIRAGGYCGLAPVADNQANVCLVTARTRGARSPLELLRRAVGSDRELGPRLAQARFDGPVRVLGPLAVDARSSGVPGLLLAGDAAGFVDPMTGDGIYLAMQGAQLAAGEALRAMDTGRFAEAVDRLTRARRAQLGARMRFNRVLRRVVGTPALVRAANLAVHASPAVLRRIVDYAGDIR